MRPLYQQEAQTRAALSALRAQPNGGAGLYDTVLAAYQNGRQGWMPGRVNLVVLVTASRDDDAAALAKIAAATGGRSYRTDGNDIGRMLLDVLTQQFASVRQGHR